MRGRRRIALGRSAGRRRRAVAALYAPETTAPVERLLERERRHPAARPPGRARSGRAQRPRGAASRRRRRAAAERAELRVAEDDLAGGVEELQALRERT